MVKLDNKPKCKKTKPTLVHKPLTIRIIQTITTDISTDLFYGYKDEKFEGKTVEEFIEFVEKVICSEDETYKYINTWEDYLEDYDLRYGTKKYEVEYDIVEVK
jgi:hypothetical protein